jgi:DNA-binding SARP family transcriptional activator
MRSGEFMQHDEDLRFAILGPLVVHFRGCPVPIGGSRERMVLASLLLAGGGPVTVDHLVETVWGGAAPQTATKAVRNSVSALRQRLAAAGGSASLIETVPAGYRLEADHCYLDARDFQDRAVGARRLGAAGKAGKAADELRAALGLWRGPALAGMDSMVIQAQAADLDEQRLAALEECLDLELAVGRHRELVSELQGVARRHPFRERLAGQLMIALYRSGRQAEALDVYRQLASRLSDDLGIDPASEVAWLREAILRQDASLNLNLSPGEGPPIARPRQPARRRWAPRSPRRCSRS